MRKAQVEGYYWHVACIYGPPGNIREDDGREPLRGDFIDRAITLSHVRRLRKGKEDGACHACMRNEDAEKGAPFKGDPEDFIVIDYDLAASLCRCGQEGHEGNRKLCDDIWKDAPNMIGAEMGAAEKLICGDCWYKDNSMPPDERRTMEEPASCAVCGDPTLEVVVLEREVPVAPQRSTVIDDDKLDMDSPELYSVKVTWTRVSEIATYYEYTIGDLDEYDLQIIVDGEFDESAWDIAYENSNKDYETDSELNGFSDDGPDNITWEVHAK